MVEQISPEQEQQSKATQAEDKSAIQQKVDQVADQAAAKADAAAADAQAALAKANQALADLPGQIEDKIKEFKDTIDSFLNAQLPAEPDSPDFDPNAIMGKLTAAVSPVLGAISPIESIVGKVPVLGDLIGSVTSVTSQSAPTTLSKDEIKKLVPNKPQVPPGLMDKIDGAIQSLMTFLQTLPMILIDVIFQMLGAIYDMFDQIVGVIGVPPPIFPFSLVKSCVSLMPKIKTMVQQLPAQVKGILMGVVQDKMAEAQALAIPAPPTIAGAAMNAAKSAAASKVAETTQAKASGATSTSQQNTPQTVAAPSEPAKPATAAPADSAVTDVPKANPIPPKAPLQPTIPEVKEQYKPIVEEFKPIILGAPGEFGMMDKMPGDAYDYIFTNATIKSGHNPDSTLHIGNGHAKWLKKTVSALKNQVVSATSDSFQAAWNSANLADKTKYKITQVKNESDYIEVIDPEKDGFFSDGHVTKWVLQSIRAYAQMDTYGMTMSSFEHKCYAVSEAYVQKFRITESSSAYQLWKSEVERQISAIEKKHPDAAKNAKAGIEKITKLLSEKYVFQMTDIPSQLYQLAEIGSK